MRPSTALPCLAVAFLFGCDDSTAPAPAPTKGAAVGAKLERIRVGTWNLEHFGQRDKFQDRADAPKNRTPEQVKAIAKFIADMSIDVLALQEIGGPEPMQNLLTHLGDDYRFALGTTGTYGETRISVGFLWNSTRVELIQCEEMADFPNKVGELAIFHRKPVNAVFRVVGGGMDFRAITVHLKASKGKKNEAKRVAEVGVLREYLATLRQSKDEDQDIVVLGDFNHTFDAPAHQAFAIGDLVRYETGTTSTTPDPSIVWFDEPIDHIATTPGIRPEIVGGSFKIHNQMGRYTAESKDKITPIELEWRVTYSDHYPATIDFHAAIDNDPGATFQKPKHALPVGGAK